MTLEAKAAQIRRDLVELTYRNGCGHYGSSLSCVDILVALHYGILSTDDAFVMSKGHAAMAVYAILADTNRLTDITGHITRLPGFGLDFLSASLGHGLPVACGMAMARKIRGLPGKVYVVMGDGECQEGTTWESLLLASRHELGNLHAIVDCNSIQGSGRTGDILPIDAITHAADGWDVAGCAGHTLDALVKTLGRDAARPQLTIALTVKGRGVSFMEDVPEWHFWKPTPQQFLGAMKELTCAATS